MTPGPATTDWSSRSAASGLALRRIRWYARSGSASGRSGSGPSRASSASTSGAGSASHAAGPRRSSQCRRVAIRSRTSPTGAAGTPVPSLKRPYRPRWTCRVRPPSYRCSRCLPKASVSRSTRPDSTAAPPAKRPWGLVTVTRRPANSSRCRAARRCTVCPSGTRPRVGGVRTDAEVPRFWCDLGLPGLVDVHVHFYPERMLRKVWRHFDESGWPITYRWPDEDRVAHLAALGVRAFTALSYAHRPGMAADLTAWALDFAARTPGCLPSGTFYPEPGVLGAVDTALAAGVRVFKVHIQVGDFDPREPVLDPVWGRLAETGTPAVVHAGSGPMPSSDTGPGPLGDVLKRHPRLTAIVAHLGVPEYGEFLD